MNFTLETVLLLVLIALAIVAVFQKGRQGGGAPLELLQSLDQRMTQVMSDVTREVATLKEIGRETSKFAEQVNALQNVLANPKSRGVFGEYMLEAVLKNVLPPGLFRMQHAFASGEIVDAAVFVDKKIIPIDSKFSLENYNRLIDAPDSEKLSLEKAIVRDLKLRIEETAKYIRPAEGTTDFAFMFIPAEGVYYDLLTNRIGGNAQDNLIQQAAARKVIIVSPTTFLAYLYTVLQGLRALAIEEKAREIEARVGELGRHMSVYQEHYRKLGGALSSVVNHYNNGGRELEKIDKDVLRITGEAHGDGIPRLDKPSVEG